MAWEHLSITKPHLVYIILGGFTSLFMLCSSIIKERMYIGEATVATLCGLIFGPHAANLIDPQSWGNVDIVTIEFSRIVLVVQCFAVGVELPKFYMERHWKSVVFLLLPVMTFGWLITSLFVWWMIPPLNWLESLVIAACVTATDPVLASSVVGKGKFAKRVPKHLRDLLSAESGCNDGMAFPFIYLALYLIQDHRDASKVSFHWIVYTILYECIFGAVFGFLIGYIARHGIKYAERHDLIDRESFLVFYFVLALFCAGSGSILGVDDLLVGFSAGVGFSNDGWFGHKTEESHVSNVIDLLLNLAYFVFLGTIIPWEMYNDTSIGLSAWRLTVIAIFVILFRRIPIMMALKPLIPDIKTWREALFAGHFGPIGVGAIFVAILARAELESESPIPLAELPPVGSEHYTLLTLVWPITTFLVISSILVHGSSVAVFTLGKRINTLTVTMSYTIANEDGPSWMNRLPRISSQSRSQARTMSDTDLDDGKPEVPPGALLPIGIPGQFLRRLRDDDGPSKHGSRASSIVSRRRRKKSDDGFGSGGRMKGSANSYPRRSIGQLPQSPSPGDLASDEAHVFNERDEPLLVSDQPSRTRAGDADKDASAEKESRRHSSDDAESSSSPGTRTKLEIYDEGDNIIVENEQGDVLSVDPVNLQTSPGDSGKDDTTNGNRRLKIDPAAFGPKADPAASGWTYDALKKRIGDWKNEELEKRKEKNKPVRRHEPARAYQFGNTIIVEDEDGEVVKKYELSPQKPDKEGADVVSQSLKYIGMGGLMKPSDRPSEEGSAGKSNVTEPAPVARVSSIVGMSNWRGFGRAATGEPSAQRQRKKSVAEEREEEDDRHIRFTIGGVGKRMTKEGFIEEMQKLDQNTRQEVVDRSSASQTVKTLAKLDPLDEAAELSTPGYESKPSKATAVSRKGRRQTGDTAGESSSDDDASHRSSSSRVEASTKTDRGRSREPTQDEEEPGPASQNMPETAVEKRRRLAALRNVKDGDSDDDNNDSQETPAERRRREAALGMSNQPADDSDDDDTPRVPPARRGIRFADTPDRRQR